ncbi:CHAT domain-containing protein [Umezawaea sp.]|uniref:CHAT domain-containing protein n=1 Tax=Umezawaea sp. TaxID=1955258 RepID=UPI002ED4EF4F
MPHGELSEQAVALHHRYRESNDLADLRASVDLLRRATAAPPPRPRRMANLGAGLILLFERLGDVELLHEALAACRRAVELAPGDPQYLSNLSAGLEQLYLHTTDEEALAEAVDTAREAVRATASGDPALMMRLSNLANSLRSTYQRTGDTAALLEAVSAGERAAAMLDGAGDEASRLLSNLANARWDLAQHHDDPDLRAEAVAGFRTAFDSTPVGHPNRPDVLSNLADRLGMTATNAAEADAAVALARRALAWTDGSSPDRAHNESCLAATLRTRFNHTGDVGSLVEAASLARSALLRTHRDHARLPSRLVEFGNALRALHERTGELAPAVGAVEATGKAVEITPVGDSARVGHLIDAASARFVLYERTGDVEHVREAVEMGKQAVHEQGADHPNLLGTLTQVIAPMVALASETNDEALFEEVVAIGRRVAALPDDHRDVVPACSNTAHALLRRHAHTDDPRDALDAARHARRAAELTPRDSALRPPILINLGATQLLVGLHDEARATFTEVTAAPAATVLDRIRAWRYLGRVEMDVNADDAAVAAFQQAVSLLPQLAPQRFPRGDREFGLGRITGLAAEAAAAAVRARRPDLAVRLVEQARTLLMSETLDARSDLRALAERHPDLHQEHQRLRGALDAADHPVVAHHVGAPPPTRREELTAQWADLLDRVRDQPGFDTFLLPPPPLVDQGPVVITYATRWGAGALLLRPDRPIDVVPLPGITDITAAEQADRFERSCLAAVRTSSYGARKAALDDVHGVLKWLWDNVTERVLDHLGFGLPTSSSWPRVWWCPISAMSSLPLHAAGHHDGDPGRTAVDRVVSSYTTSLRTHAREPRAAADSSAVVVAMPETPGAGALPSAESEAETITGLVPGSVGLVRAEATRAAVVEALPRHAITHFACHAVGDPRDPSASRLLLHDHETDALTVAEVFQLDLPNADLVFLSACNTTDTAPRLVDEAIHITGAFHLAGYRHVIGTLTPVNATAARVAAAVYGLLTLGGTVAPDTAGTALALHHAVRLIRTDHPGAPHTWAAWIHVGI